MHRVEFQAMQRRMNSVRRCNVRRNVMRMNDVKRCNVRREVLKMGGVKRAVVKMNSVRMSIAEKPKRAISSNVLCGSFA